MALLRIFSIGIVLLAATVVSAAGPETAAPENTVRTAIREYLAAEAGVPAAETYVGGLRFMDARGVTAGATVVRVVADGAIRSGRGVYFSLYLREPAVGVREVRVLADVSLLVPVVVSARNVPAGAVIGTEDVSVRMREYNASVEGLCHRPADAVGKKARWQLTSGIPIRREYLEDPQALRRGDPVLVVVESGRVRITGKGVALQGGRIGETVSVRNLASGKDTTGRLQPDHVVLVD